MNIIQEERAKAVKHHIDIINFNAQKSGNFKVICNMDNQLEKYESRIVRLSLPHRFGMYKTQMDMPKTTEVELDTPCEEPMEDSTIEREDGKTHRVRGIF